MIGRSRYHIGWLLARKVPPGPLIRTGNGRKEKTEKEEKELASTLSLHWLPLPNIPNSFCRARIYRTTQPFEQMPK